QQLFLFFPSGNYVAPDQLLKAGLQRKAEFGTPRLFQGSRIGFINDHHPAAWLQRPRGRTNYSGANARRNFMQHFDHDHRIEGACGVINLLSVYRNSPGEASLLYLVPRQLKTFVVDINPDQARSWKRFRSLQQKIAGTAANFENGAAGTK